MSKEKEGYIGGKHWTESSAPTGADWTNLARRLLIAEATIEELEKRIKSLETPPAKVETKADAKVDNKKA